MTSAPPQPPGWKLEPVVPESQRQAQDTVTGYLTKTLQALPPGTVFDATRYRVGNGNRSCDDSPTGSGKPEMMFNDVRQAILPSGTNAATAIRQAGDAWRGWGWYVVERDDFDKPNQFGYGPDGYRLQIESPGLSGHPPTISGISPCFPGDIARDDISVPVTLGGQ